MYMEFFIDNEVDLLEQVEIYEDINESSFISKLMLPIKIRKNGRKEGYVVGNMVDYLKKGYNPGLRKVIEQSKDIDELQYIRRDTQTMVPTIQKVKERISLCKKLGKTDKTKGYYDYIKKHYIDNGITEKHCDIALEEIKKQNKMISDRIKELKK